MGGGGGVNPIGQPDRFITVFFFDDFPKQGVAFSAASCLGAGTASTFSGENPDLFLKKSSRLLC